MLDAELAVRDGEDHAYYAQFNKIDMIKHAVIVYIDNVPCGCGAIKAFSKEAMEVKRMYVSPNFRCQGIAIMILNELEKWTLEEGYTKCVLETGYQQPEALALYKKCGYQIIPNYGQYEGIENSVCFEKKLIQ
jgi:GNAT superfamily N-acetyltransferase